MELRSAIQQIALEQRLRRYGYRRMSAELRRRGTLANHKRVVRLMRGATRGDATPGSLVVTTDSHHELEVYLNLACRMKLTGIHQLSGGRHHVHSTESRVCVLSGDLGWILSQGGGLGTGANAD